MGGFSIRLGGKRLAFAALLALGPAPLLAQTTADAGPPVEHDVSVGSWPKIGLDTTVAVELAGFSAESGRDRGAGPSLRLDASFLAEFNDSLSLAALFQVKPREPLPADDPNRDFFINQGAGRREGGKFKELYIRYGDWRVGKFVQAFGRAYALLPGPYAADLIEEPEEGYEPSDMLGVEKIYVFNDESKGWRQLTLSAFMVDRTVLHESFPYNEGRIHYRDGGVGNTKAPENLMATFDVFNRPVGNWAHLNYQASAIRWGKTYGTDRGEIWTTLGADLTVPLRGTIAETLRGEYAQVVVYAEGARRDNFEGVAGRARNWVSGSVEYLTGPWTFDFTTTQRWTTDRADPTRYDRLYSATAGYGLPTNTLAAVSLAHETIGGRSGVYAGLRITQTLTTCDRCLVKGRPY
jgi:hypothetical protein